MGVELRERKWCGVLGIEKMNVKDCWIIFTIVHGLRMKQVSLIYLQSTSKIKQQRVKNSLTFYYVLSCLFILFLLYDT